MLQPNQDQKEAFERLARNRDMKEVIVFYETLLAKTFTVNSVDSLKDLLASQKALKFIQTEFIDRLKNYEPDTKVKNADNNYL